MALPVGVQVTNLTFGGDVDFGGGQVRASVTVVPTHDAIWKATGQRLVSFPLTASTGPGVQGQIALPVVNQSGFADGAGNDYAFWAYIVTVTYTGSATETVTKNIQPLAGQVSIDFDSVPSGPITPGVTAPTAVVTSVNGQTGAVTVTGGSGGSSIDDSTTSTTATWSSAKTNAQDQLALVKSANLSDLASTTTARGNLGAAADATVVHLAGTETVTGAKTFTAPPTVPTPTADGHAAPRAYVDSAVAASGGGAGGAGLTYAGVKSADYQAAPNEYVHTDNSGGSFTVTAPAAAASGTRFAVHNTGALSGANKTTVAAGAGQVFDNGLSTFPIDQPGMGAEWQAVGGGVWALRSLTIPETVNDTKYEPAGTTALAVAPLQDAVAALQQAPKAPTRGLQVRGTPGALSVGAFMDPGTFLEQGFTALAARAYLSDPPTGGPLVVTASIAGTVVYTFTIPAGAFSYADTAPNGGAGVVIPDSSLISFDVTQVGSTFPGSGLLLVFSEQVGAPPKPTIGTVSGLVVTAQAGAFTGSWGYAAKDTLDDLDHYAVRYQQGTAAPATLNQGTVGPDVSGQIDNPSVTVTGLLFSTTYAVSVFPVGVDGAVGTAASATFTTGAKDTTAPNPGTITLTSSSSTVTVTVVPDAATSSDITGGYLRRANASTAAPTSLSSGHPALVGLTPTGAGTWVPCGPGGITATDTGLNASANYAYAWFPKDSSGNQQNTPATQHIQTLAAPTGGRGIYGLFPSTWGNPYTETFTGRTSAWIQDTTNPQWAVDNGWKHREQGPSRRQNWTIIDDGSGSNNILRIAGQFVNNGWYVPGAKNWDLTWADGVTTGSGWYGSRGNIQGQTQLYGGYELRVRTTSPATIKFGNNWKGGNIQGWPTANWPQNEFDTREQFQAGSMGCNNHYWDPTIPVGQPQKANSQLSATWNVTDGNWQVFSFLWYPPGFFAADAPSRIMTYMDNVLRFDTGIHGTGIATVGPTPSTLGATKISYLLNGPMSGSGATVGPQHWDLGFSLAYTGYNDASGNVAAGFTAANGTAANQRESQFFDIDSINIFSTQ